MRKAMVLFSGGLDSTTCLAMTVKQLGKENTIALSMSYGQKHKKEVECSHKIAEYYGVKQIEIDLAEVFKTSNCSLLTHSEKEIPLESYDEQIKHTGGKPVSTYVPFRNGLFLSVATSMAISEGCDAIVYGIHRDDSAGSAYPDCSKRFDTAMSMAIWEGSGQQVRLYAPFVEENKASIVKIGLMLKVPYELTWSCYEGGDKPCGKCGTCIDRIKAFEMNGVKDPLWTE